jgi:hypothetical protein
MYLLAHLSLINWYYWVKLTAQYTPKVGYCGMVFPYGNGFG